MAAELQLQSPNGTSFGMWNNNNDNDNNNKVQVQVQVQVTGEDEDDSWEVRAFEEDITAGNKMGCTWPPRSYTCNFCRREFRSAQALGGHMNVHRRDRARLHQQVPLVIPPSSSSNDFPNSSTILVPSQEFLPNGLCLFYSLPNPNGVFTKNSPSSANDHLSSVSPNNYPLPAATDMSAQYSNQTEPSSFISNDNINEGQKDSAIEELDLELRLGCGLPTPP